MGTQRRAREPSRAPITLDDLTGDLIWPRLLRAASLGLGPSRLGIAFFTVVFLAIIGMLADWIGGLAGDGPGEGVAGPRSLGELALVAFNGVLDGVARLHPADTAAALYWAFVGAPVAAITQFPASTIVAVLLGVPVVAIAGGAISRMAACEFAVGLSMSWPQGLGFAISRLGSLVGALAGPIVVVWVVALLVALGGALLRVPVLNILVGALYGLALLLAFIAVLVMIAYFIGKPLLIPAVTCDGADAIDSIQRAYAYVYGRPLRLAAYLAVLLAQALFVLLLAQLIMWGVQILAEGAARALAGERGASIFAAVRSTETAAAEEAGATGAAAAWFIRLWLAVAWGLVWAYAMSFYFCASTLLYLAMRRMVDGQDMHELWLPGMVNGTGAEQGDATPAPAGSGDGAWVE